MEHHPLPVVVISSLTARGSEAAIRAVELGAIEVLCKPCSAYRIETLEPVLLEAVRAAAIAKPRRLQAPVERVQPFGLRHTTDQILAIGASTGGTEAIRALIERLPPDSPATVIVQHMPPNFTTAFAERLNRCGTLRVSEARGGETLTQGHAYIAPGGKHLTVQRDGGHYRLELDDGERVHFQKPAVDVTFASVARTAGANAIGVLLTGMGRDGADGLLAMRQAGAHTVAQDEESCVVYGMPRAAVECGAACKVLPLERIAEHIVTHVSINAQALKK